MLSWHLRQLLRSYLSLPRNAAYSALRFTSDKAGHPVPAPGRGALTVAREIPSKYPLPIPDVSYRSRQRTFRRRQISQWLLHKEQQLQDEIQYRRSQNETVNEDYVASCVADLEKEANDRRRMLLLCIDCWRVTTLALPLSDELWL